MHKASGTSHPESVEVILKAMDQVTKNHMTQQSML